MSASKGEPLVSLEEFRLRAKELLSPEGWMFFNDAALRRYTYLDSMAAFNRYVIRPRVLRDVTKRSNATTVLGQPVSMPICVAPTASHRYAHPDAEKATAKGVADAGTIMVLSSLSNESIAEVARAAPGGLRWMQLYLTKNRKHAEYLIREAERADYKALVLTVDVSKEPKRTFSLKYPVEAGPQYITDYKLRWINYDVPSIPEVEAAKRSGDTALYDYIIREMDAANITWDHVRWLKSMTSLPIVLKGILTAEDAREAAAAGAAGIVVSAHGGRLLDGVPAPIDALREVVAAVRGLGVEVYMDGGVRSGTDALKAIGLGARAVFVGRPAIWGLACDGAAGVTKVLSILEDEFDSALALSGYNSPTDLPPSLVIPKSSY